jgi:protein phosphatase
VSAAETFRPTTNDVDAFGLTHQGKVRGKNDDHFLIASLHKLMKVHLTSLPEPEQMPLVSESRGFLFIVADGVGGRPDGNVASGTALRVIAQYVTHLVDLYNALDDDKETAFLADLVRSVEKSHQILVKEGQRDSGGHGMATTLTMVATIWPRAYLVQVGDSRCYRLRGGRLERISRDQTMAEALVDAGALSQTAAERSPLKNMLASALGGKEARVVTRRSDIEWDDVMLLCSDGLTKHLSEEEIEAELRVLTSAEATCRRLVDLALERGGSDNVTVVIGRLKPRPPAQDGVGAGGAGSARSAR